MKIIAMSDLHGQLPTDVPVGDALVIAGDVCPGGRAHGQADWFRCVFEPWADSQPVRHVLLTWGNHDWVGEEFDVTPSSDKVVILTDRGCEIDGVRFWGTPWSLPFCYWAFMAPEEELRDRYAHIPEGTDVLISHGPPYGRGDLTVDGYRAGNRPLRERMDQIRPQLTVFGHIHEGHTTQSGWANVSLLDQNYIRRWSPLTCVAIGAQDA